MSKAYPSNLTQAQLLKRLDSAEPKPGGRLVRDMWDILNAIFHILCEGCPGLPGDSGVANRVYLLSQLA